MLRPSHLNQEEISQLRESVISRDTVGNVPSLLASYLNNFQMETNSPQKQPSTTIKQTTNEKSLAQSPTPFKPAQASNYQHIANWSKQEQLNNRNLQSSIVFQQHIKNYGRLDMDKSDSKTFQTIEPSSPEPKQLPQESSLYTRNYIGVNDKKQSVDH